MSYTVWCSSSQGTTYSASQPLYPDGFGYVRIKFSRAFGSRLIRPWLSRGQLSHLMVLCLLERRLPLEQCEEDLPEEYELE